MTCISWTNTFVLIKLHDSYEDMICLQNKWNDSHHERNISLWIYGMVLRTSDMSLYTINMVLMKIWLGSDEDMAWLWWTCGFCMVRWKMLVNLSQAFCELKFASELVSKNMAASTRKFLQLFESENCMDFRDKISRTWTQDILKHIIDTLHCLWCMRW